jgi:hypothetical protein
MYFQDSKNPFNLETVVSISKYWDDINQSIIDVTKNLGQTNDDLKKSGSYSSTLNKGFVGAANRLEKMGINASVVSSYLKTMSDHTGTMVGFSEDAMVKFGTLQKLIGETNVTNLSQGFLSIGKGLSTSLNMIDEIRISSVKLGLNAEKVAKTMSQNFKSASNISFKGGSKEIAKMAEQSVLLGIEMSQVLSKAKQLRSPEQAIEFSQNMQMLGGDFASLFGDASTVLYNARNNTKQFQKDISKASSNLITMNEETGELEVLPDNFDKASLAAQQLGMDVDEFLESGKKAKKLSILKDSFGSLTEDQANVLSGFANLKEGGKITLEGLDKETLSKLGLEENADITSLGVDKMSQLVEQLKGITPGQDQQVKSAEDQVQATTRLSDIMSNTNNILMSQSKSMNELSIALNQNKDSLKSRYEKQISERGTIGKEAKDIYDAFGLGLNMTTEKISKLIDEYLDKMTSKPVGTLTPPPGGLLTTQPTKVNTPSTTPVTPPPGGLKPKRKGDIIETFGDGGVFNGPSHENGGIPIKNKSTGKMLEVEGGEAIINKKSTEMFKPLLSKINESGGGVKFAEGGITPVDLENVMSKIGSLNTNVNIGSNSPINVNVNVNGSISIDGDDFKIPDDEKEKLSKDLMKQVMIKVNSEIGNGTIFTAGKRKTADNTFNY